MKLHRLDLQGVGAFRGKQRIDFDQAAEAGLFLITGATGSGKSTVLDAVSYALYGSVPRYLGDVKRIRSDHCVLGEDTWVSLEFSVRGCRYRVVRSPEYERPYASKTKVGTTTERAKVALEQWQDGWDTLATKDKEVGALVNEVVGLSSGQFQQVILLAQGKFMEFLQAKSQDRRAVLSAIFSTGRFEEVRKSLHDLEALQAKELEQLLTQITDRVGSLVARLEEADPQGREIPAAVDSSWLAEQLVRVRQLVEEAAVKAEAADEVVERLRHDVELTHNIARLQARRTEASSSLAVLAERQPQIDLLRRQISQARKANTVLPLIQIAAGAAESLAQARIEVAESESCCRNLVGADVAEAVRTRQELLGRLAAGVQVEAKLADVRRQLQDSRHEAEVLDQRRVTLAAELEAFPLVRQELEAEVHRLNQVAERLAQTRDDLVQAKRQHAAAEQLVVLDERIASERALLAVASDNSAAARAMQTEATARYLTSIAGILADELQAGCACPVCGATEHPQLAVLDPEAPDQTQLDQFEQEAAAADTELRSVGMRVESLLAERGELRVAAAGLSVAVLEGVVRRLSAEVDQAEAAQVDQARVSERLRSLAANQADLVVQLDELIGERGRVGERIAVLEAAMTQSVTQIDIDRGAYESVAARVSALEQELGVLSDLTQARQKVETYSARQKDADSAVHAGLAEQGFDSIETVQAAALPTWEVEEAERGLSEYLAQKAALEHVLADPEVLAVPEEAVDVTVVRDSLLQAEAEAKAVRSGLDRLSERAAHVFSIRDELEQRLQKSVMQRQDHAVLRDLAETLSGRGSGSKNMDLETFVLAAKLEEIVIAANLRLRAMSDGRYELQHDPSPEAHNAKSGLGLAVIDGHTGKARSPESLSGGETFLASLALALGLADVVSAESGGIQLDTLFIDEGFGSLDPDALDAAITALEGLRANGRVVGLISHVAAMKERIPAAIEIRRKPTYDSEIVMNV